MRCSVNIFEIFYVGLSLLLIFSLLLVFVNIVMIYFWLFLDSFVLKFLVLCKRKLLCRLLYIKLWFFLYWGIKLWNC